LVSNTTTYDLTDNLQIKNIFGASRSFQDFVADQLGVPFGISVDYNIVSGGIGNKTTLKNYSDELQLLGKAFDGQLDYVAGLYGSSNRHNEFDDLTYFELVPILPGSPSTFIFDTTSKSKAAYAQGTYDLGKLTGITGLKFTAGARYTWETDGLQYPTDRYALLSGQSSESKQFSSPSWQAGFDYQINSQLLLYLTTRGSWRSGGFNGYSPSNPTLAQFGGNEFLPEKTHDVEFGAKFRGELLNMPAVLNIAIYNQWITNIQRVTYTFTGGNASAFTGNIPAGQVHGTEFDAQISPSTWFTLGLTGAYTDAAFTDGVAAAYGGGVLNFGPMGDVSRWSGSVYGQVRLAVPSEVGEMSLRAEMYAQTSEYFSNLASTITPETRLPGYGLLNLRYEWKDVFSSKLTASVFSKNTLNKGYYTGGEAFGVDFGLNSAAPAEPRTYGVELNYRF
jgi:iron complex outermembrane receptor protein